MSGSDAELERIAVGYREFAKAAEASDSPTYAALSRAVADDPDVLQFLAGLPPGKRQPNLLLATLQYLNDRAPEDARQLRSWVLDDGARVKTTMAARSTQTNEPARCAALLPVLAALPGPLALIEVGASSGLCLYPDRYSYAYDGRPVGEPSAVHLRCETSGPVPVPEQLPAVAARIGVDLHPLDARDADDRAWLRALVWPGPRAADRLARLDAAAAIVAAEPPVMLVGDLLDRLPDALARVPDGATPVVLATAVLMYLPRPRRAAFVELVRDRSVPLVTYEMPGVLPDVDAALPPDPDRDLAGRMVVALDGRPVALAGGHGGRLDWLAAESPA